MKSQGKPQYRKSAARRGGILITTLIISTIIASMLAGMGALLTSYYSRSVNETNYANAINLADAGINYELRRITTNVANADLPGSSTPKGTTVAFGNGSFRVYCTMSDGLTSWDKSTTPFCIYSTGISGTASRSIKVGAISPGGSGRSLGLFAVNSGASANGTPTITGNVESDGTLSFVGTPTVTGSVTFDGPSAGWGSSSSGTFGSIVTFPNAVLWPTVSQVALSLFPNSGATAPGGLSYLSIRNDNLTAIPPISSKTISLSGSSTCTLVGKPGGSNYYLTNLSTAGNTSLLFDNTLGPITVWVGPAGGSGTFSLNGGTASVQMSADPTKPVRFYVATTSGVTLVGKSELDAGIYNVTGGSSTVTVKGTASTYGTIVCDVFSLSGTPNIFATSGFFSASGSGTYVFYNSWAETDGM